MCIFWWGEDKAKLFEACKQHDALARKLLVIESDVYKSIMGGELVRSFSDWLKTSRSWFDSNITHQSES